MIEYNLLSVADLLEIASRSTQVLMHKVHGYYMLSDTLAAEVCLTPTLALDVKAYRPTSFEVLLIKDLSPAELSAYSALVSALDAWDGHTDFEYPNSVQDLTDFFEDLS